MNNAFNEAEVVEIQLAQNGLVDAAEDAMVTESRRSRTYPQGSHIPLRAQREHAVHMAEIGKRMTRHAERLTELMDLGIERAGASAP